MADRYGTPSRSGKVATRIVAGAFAVLFAVVLGWVIVGNSSPDTKIKVLTFQVLDEHSVTTDVDVFLKDGIGEATCVVRAGAIDGALVGETQFTSTGGRQTVEIRTDRKATTVMEGDCTPTK